MNDLMLTHEEDAQDERPLTTEEMIAAKPSVILPEKLFVVTTDPENVLLCGRVGFVENEGHTALLVWRAAKRMIRRIKAGEYDDDHPVREYPTHGRMTLQVIDLRNPTPRGYVRETVSLSSEAEIKDWFCIA